MFSFVVEEKKIKYTHYFCHYFSFLLFYPWRKKCNSLCHTWWWNVILIFNTISWLLCIFIFLWI